MSAVAVPQRRRFAIERPQQGGRPRRFDDGVTLEDRILGAWEALVADGRTGCPVCGGSMAAGTGCSDCGSHLT